MKHRLLLIIIAIIPNLLRAEGSHEVWRDLPNHATYLYLCNDLGGHCSWLGSRSNFAVYDCDPDERLYFSIENTDEDIYFGFRGDMVTNNTRIVYRIRNELATIVYPEADLPTAGQGYINNIAEARVGPLQLSGAGGYDALQFTPPAPGVYYIEFSLINNSTGNRVNDVFYIELFDITVYNTVAAEIKTGRLYSKSWQFYDGETPGWGQPWKVNSSSFYIYSSDSIITSVTYDEMEGRAWLMFCNQFGCQNTGNFVIDRMSLQNQQAFVPEYRIFLNVPDSNLFPPASTTGQIIPPTWAEAFCDGTKIFHVTVDKAGNLQIILDFDPPYVDRILETSITIGENLISWDGLDGMGNPVPNNVNINFSLTYINGLTNLPLYDIEENLNGFSIELIAPTGPVPLVYWDDSNIPGGSTNFAGCNSTPPNPGCHAFNYGNEHTINTWWYSASTTTDPVLIVEERGPDVLVFNQPPQSYCAGEFGVYISVTPDPNTEIYNWSYTGTGATITHANPADNFITIDFALGATPGNIEVFGTNTNCGDGPVSTLTVTIAPVPGGLINVLPNDTVCINEMVSFAGSDTAGTNVILWQWNFGDGNGATGQNTTHTYTNPVNANVRLIITTNNGCADTAFFPLVVVDPVIDFSTSPNPGCIGDTVYFYGTGNASFTDWLWDFGDGNTAVGDTVWHIYNTSGTQPVTLDVCTKSASHTH
ncbi:MAG: PKD domain-containing protein, partial [Bacteroidales bacterium]|nr:PKD domain-containing protein [Bacteroidales bacterium]